MITGNEAQRHREMVLSRCVRIDGQWVRGYTDLVNCRKCGGLRYDNGLRCPHDLSNGTPCRAYQNPKIEEQVRGTRYA